MAIIITSNHYKFQLMSAAINFSSDTLTAILMKDTFEFNMDTHATLALITASQVATKNGYTQDSHNFATPSLTEDDTNNKGAYTCDNLTITADTDEDALGIGPIGGYCIVDNTTSDDTVICFVDFNVLFDSVTDGSTAGASVFTSAGSSWDVDGLIGKKLVISTGSDIGYYLITDNTATTITVAETFTGTESDLVATIQTLVDYTISSMSSIQLQNVAISVA
jgi:hypothetical protein